MKIRKVSALSTTQLVEKFIETAITQGDALLVWDTRTYNHLYDKMLDIERELKSRPGDQRSVLLSLLSHPNIAVRWKAAVATLMIAPTAAREALYSVATAQYMPISGHASSTLHYYDNGTFSPT